MKPNISLGESNTPLLRLTNLEQVMAWRGEIWAKCEYISPTGSFKDRGSVAEVALTQSQKKAGVVCASTGNMAASLSAYSAKAKLECVVFVPTGTPKTKLEQATICGATIQEVDGNYDLCVEMAKKYAKSNNYMLCGDYEIRRRGQSSIGLELAESKVNIDAFIVPLGNGTVACGISEGLATHGLFPKLIGVQGQNASPIYQAFISKTKITPISNPQTIGSAMNVGKPLDGTLTLDWIQKTGGSIYDSSDQDITMSKSILATAEGLYVESAAAATVSILPKYPNKDETIVLILTGSGLKERL